MTLILAAVIGVVVGFLGGLLGKGGSAIATPMLHAVGVPAIVAIAAPLPAAIPSTLAAGYAYSRQHLVDWRVVRSSALFGVPATIMGAVDPLDRRRRACSSHRPPPHRPRGPTRMVVAKIPPGNGTRTT